MKHFATLVDEVSASTKTTGKMNAIISYFAKADDADKIWMLA